MKISPVLATLIMLFSGEVRADLPSYASYYCANDVEAGPNVQRTVVILFKGSPPGDRPELADPTEAQRYVRGLAKEVYELCKNVKPSAIFPHLRQARIVLADVRTFWLNASYNYDLDKASITNFAAQQEEQKREFEAMLERKHRENDERARQNLQEKLDNERRDRQRADEAAAAKRAQEQAVVQAMAQLRVDRSRLQAKFGADLGNPSDLRWVQPQNVAANPFKFGAGKSGNARPIVVMRVVFSKMVAADVAQFGGFLNPMFVYGVPTDRFDTPDKAVILAYRLAKVTPVGEQPFGMGDNLLQSIVIKALADARQPTVEAEYVGAYDCRQWDCSDIIEPTRAASMGIQ